MARLEGPRGVPAHAARDPDAAAALARRVRQGGGRGAEGDEASQPGDQTKGGEEQVGAEILL